MTRIISVAALVAVMSLVAVGSASAHYGDRWFQTRAGITEAVEGKYRLDVFKTCIPSGTTHTLTDPKGFGATSYDHFSCLVDVEFKPGRACWATAHVTGQRWTDIVLTSDVGTRNIGGCGPTDIRHRGR